MPKYLTSATRLPSMPRQLPRLERKSSSRPTRVVEEKDELAGIPSQVLQALARRMNHFGGANVVSVQDARHVLYQLSSGLVTRTQQEKNADIISIKDYGAVGDGVTDDSKAIQDAIDDMFAAGGGSIWCPPGEYRCNVTLNEGVWLIGPILGYLASGTARGAVFQAASAGAVIDTPVTSIFNCAVMGVNVNGLGAGTAANGIRFRDVSRGMVKLCNANNFSDEGILVDSTSGACVFEDILAINCLLDRSQAAKIGAVDIDGHDHFIRRIEATSSQSSLSDANAYLCGVVIRGDNCFVQDVIGETSDEGIHVPDGATYNRFVNCRADLNLGHGFHVIGDSNQFDNCLALNNSQETTNTYDGFFAASTSGLNQFANCKSDSTTAKVQRYGFNDNVQAATTKNTYINPTASGSGTAAFNSQSTAGSAFSFPAGTQKTLTANSATPDVTGYERFETANSNPTTITNFTNGVQGQKLTIRCGDSNTTIQHNGATISLFNSGNLKLVSGRIYQFVRMGAVWRQVIDRDEQVSADKGNAAATLQARVNETTNVWDTTLTADRAVTLSTTGAYNGAKFRIVRTANATGAFNLNVGTGPLKALGIGEWCDVEYNGSAWFLSAYGAL